MDEPDPKRGLGIEALTGQEEPSRRRGADSRQDERRDHGRDDPELDLGEAEDRIGRGHRHVGAADEARAAAERVALHPPDDRGGAGVDRLQHAVEAERVLDVLLVGEIDRRALPVDVGAGTEALTFSGEQDRTCVADVGEGVRQLLDQRRIEGVPALGPCQRDL